MSGQQPAKQETPAGSPAPQQGAQAYAQWPATPIPIDPALQQTTNTTTAASPYQHYQPYSYYGGHYQYQTPTSATPQPVQPQRTGTVATPSAQASTSNASGGMDTSDVATLNDALGSAGVDLRAEEESLQRAHDHHAAYRSYNNEDRSRKQPPKPAFDTMYLGTTMRTIGNQHKITRVPEESVNYMALALRARLQDLITDMIAAAHHRTDTQFDRPASLYEDGQPMWSILVRSDVAKQLAALEKVEREEETRIRRERKERADMAAAHAAALAAQASSSNPDVDMEDMDSSTGKKRKKKEGPGVTARNMSEDVRKKMSNAVASQAAGIGGKYSWMTAANAGSAAPAKAKAPAAAAASPTPPATTTTPATSGGWARPYQTTKKAVSAPPTPVEEDDDRLPITLRDAMFVIEKERGHGGGRGAAKGWT